MFSNLNEAGPHLNGLVSKTVTNAFYYNNSTRKINLTVVGETSKNKHQI